jgi:hypothetical protein
MTIPSLPVGAPDGVRTLVIIVRSRLPRMGLSWTREQTKLPSRPLPPILHIPVYIHYLCSLFCCCHDPTFLLFCRLAVHHRIDHHRIVLVVVAAACGCRRLWNYSGTCSGASRRYVDGCDNKFEGYWSCGSHHPLSPRLAVYTLDTLVRRQHGERR